MTHKHLVSLVALISGIFVAGCASSQMSRIDRNRDLYESWPLEIRQSVLDGKVEPGMTPEMVRVTWGEPSEIVVQSVSGDEIWVYKRGGSDGSVYYPGGGMGGGMGGVIGGPGIGISTGRGGTTIGATGGIGMGGGGVGVIGPGGGMGSPIMTPPTPPDIREVTFRNGIVHKADAPWTR